MSPNLAVTAAPAGPELGVIDATALLFRAYHGVPSRTSPYGVQVGGVLGMASWAVSRACCVRSPGSRMACRRVWLARIRGTSGRRFASLVAS